jgi:hypothetical protein
MEIDTRGSLAKKLICSRIIEVAKDKQEMKQLLDELDFINRSLTNGTPPTPKAKYSGPGAATKAFLKYMEATGSPETKDDIAQGVVDDGWRAIKPSGATCTDDETRLRIIRALDSHLTGKSAKHGKLKKINGLVGLSEWEADRFTR